MKRPGIRVLFMSGCAGEICLKEGPLWPDHELLQEPFRKPELARAVCADSALLWVEDTEIDRSARIPLLDAHELYSVRETRGSDGFEKREVSVEDIFVNESAMLKRTLRLGLPTDRSGSGVRNPFYHLNCYSLKPPRFKKLNVQVRIAFGTLDLTLKRPNVLRTPSVKEFVSEAP